MRRRSVLAVFGVVVASVLSLLAYAADDSKPEEAPHFEFLFPDAPDSTIAFHLRSNERLIPEIQHVTVRQIGGQTFFVGLGSSNRSPSGWQEGKFVWVNVVDVIQFTVL